MNSKNKNNSVIIETKKFSGPIQLKEKSLKKDLPLVENKYKNNVFFTNKSYTIKDMAKFLKGRYEIDFYSQGYEELKEQAFSKNSYLIDICCDIKELLEEKSKIRHDNINHLLEIFMSNINSERGQRSLEREKAKLQAQQTE